MTHTDSKLLESLKNSEQSALKSIFEAHYPMVFRSIYRLIPDTALAEDLSQEVFLKLWEKRLKINIKSSIAAYIRKMSVNEALGQLRKNKKMRIEAITEIDTAAVDSTETIYLQHEMQEHLHRAIDKLPHRCRLIFLLSRFEELSYKEISDQLDISPKTVENQISKALKLMRKAVQSYSARSLFLMILLQF